MIEGGFVASCRQILQPGFFEDAKRKAMRMLRTLGPQAVLPGVLLEDLLVVAGGVVGDVDIGRGGGKFENELERCERSERQKRARAVRKRRQEWATVGERSGAAGGIEASAKKELELPATDRDDARSRRSLARQQPPPFVLASLRSPLSLTRAGPRP